MKGAGAKRIQECAGAELFFGSFSVETLNDRSLVTPQLKGDLHGKVSNMLPVVMGAVDKGENPRPKHSDGYTSESNESADDLRVLYVRHMLIGGLQCVTLRGKLEFG